MAPYGGIGLTHCMGVAVPNKALQWARPSAMVYGFRSAPTGPLNVGLGC